MNKQTIVRSIERGALRALRLFVCMTLLLAFAGSAAAQEVWNGSADVSWYDIHTTEFTLSTPEQLAGLARLVNEGNDFQGKTVRLAADILLNDTGGWESWGADSRPANTWTPIGAVDKEDSEIAFSGTFDGQGHVVRGIYVDGEWYAGLFGCVNGGTVKNVSVAESYIAGEYAAGAVAGGVLFVGKLIDCHNSGRVASGGEEAIHVGGIAGFNSGMMDSCYNSGAVESVGVALDANGVLPACGGVAGRTGGFLMNSYNSGPVKACGAHVGGIAGYNGGIGTIEECCNSGTVTGADDALAGGKELAAGGIVGYNIGSLVKSCRNSGAVVGDLAYMGGIVGGTFNGRSVDYCYNIAAVEARGEDDGACVGGIAGASVGSQINCGYNMGAIKVSNGGTRVGGVVGYNEENRVGNCYFLAGDLPGIGGGTGSGEHISIAGKPLEAFASGEVAYLLGEAGSRWGQSLVEGREDPYPVLDGLKVAEDGNGGYKNVLTTDESDRFLIHDAAELCLFAQLVNAGDRFVGKTVLLMNDIALNDTEGWESWSADNKPANTWTPIGASDKEVDRIVFCGTFDGQEHVVRGIYVNGGFTAGLFGCVNGGTVKNVSVEESYIAGDGYVGGIVGENVIQGTIAHCFNRGTVKGSDSYADERYVGGIVGYNAVLSTVESCQNSGLVEGSDAGSLCVGGIAGVNSLCVVGCLNDGVVRSGVVTDGKESYVGGIVGESRFRTFGCLNRGPVTGDGVHTGGIVGFNSGMGGTNGVRGCDNMGSVTGTGDGFSTGGIVGLNVGDVEGCHNRAMLVSGFSTVGGIVGYGANADVIRLCYNAGSVKGDGFAIGGFAGYLKNCQVERCYNIGAVTAADDRVGSFLGYNDGSVVENCYFLAGDLAGIGGGVSEGERISVASKSMEAFASGEVACLLGEGWGQSLDEFGDSCPILTLYLDEEERAAKTVYAVAFPRLGDPSRTRYTNAGLTVALPVEELLTPEEQERFDRWSVTDSEGRAVVVTENAFVMPSSDVTVVAEFVYVPSYYSLYIEPNDSVRLTADATTVEEGYAFTLTAEVAAGYDPSTLLVEYREGFYGSWNALAPSADGIYRIASVYDDIYVRASVLPEELPTGIEGVEGLKVYAEGGTLFVQTPGPERVTVISLAGHLVASDTRSGLRRYMGLASGAYLVRIGERTVKIRIR